MTVTFCKEVPSLLVRFQSDAEKLSLMVELIPMLPLSADIIGPHIGHVKGLLEKLKHACMTNSEEKLLMTLSLALHHLFQTDYEVVKREAEVTIHELAQELIEQVQHSLKDDAKLLENDQDGTTSIPSKSRVKSKGKDLSDAEFKLRVSLCRLACLIRYVNVREYLPSDLSSVPAGRKSGDQSNGTKQLDGLDSVISGLVAAVHRRTRNIPHLREELRHADTVKHALMVLYLDLLWLTSPVFKDAEAHSKRQLEKDPAIEQISREDFVNQSIREQIEGVLQSRAALEDCLVSVLEMHLEKTQPAGNENSEQKGEEIESQPTEMEEIVFENEEITTYVKESQRIAFLTFCDTRCLFVEKFEEATPPYDALHWPLPRILVLLTQMYFENEMEAADLEEPERENGAEENEAPNPASEEQQVRKAELLVALGRVSVSNPSNRRQSAAVLRYFTENTKHSVDIVKAFSKYVKNETPVRYLEVQMTALRQQYNSILALKDELDAVTTSNDDEDARQELQETVEHSEAQLKDLAKKLSQSLGVGKISTSLRAPFFRFLCEGVRFSLERREHFAFLDPLRPYLGHLDVSSMKQLRTYFLQLLEDLNEAPGTEEEFSQDWRIVFDFQSAITSKRKERPPPASAPVSSAAYDGILPAEFATNESDSKTRKRSLEMQADTGDAEGKADNSRLGNDAHEQEAAQVEKNAAPEKDATLEVNDAVLSEVNGHKSELPRPPQRELDTPVKRQRRSATEQSTTSESVASAEKVDVETPEDTPNTAGEARKRSIPESEPRRTRASFTKRKQARNQTDGDVKSNNASENEAEAPAGDEVPANDGALQAQVQLDNNDEIDSRRARRRRRSLLLGQL